MLVQAVLFDVDDTLVNLSGAQHVAFRQQLATQFGDHVSTHPAMPVAAETFVDDPMDYYNSYINGHLTFAEHRLQRVGEAMNILELAGKPDEELWIVGYEEIVSRNWSVFDDVSPLLSTLDQHGIRYGAVTNNVTDYQAHKLEQAGLPMDVVIGTDVTGKPKPHASMFLEGVRQLKSDPGQTVMIGDDVINDGLGARDAGLISVLVDRQNTLTNPDKVHKIRTLSDVLHIGSLRFDNRRI